MHYLRASLESAESHTLTAQQGIGLSLLSRDGKARRTGIPAVGHIPQGLLSRTGPTKACEHRGKSSWDGCTTATPLPCALNSGQTQGQSTARRGVNPNSLCRNVPKALQFPSLHTLPPCTWPSLHTACSAHVPCSLSTHPSLHTTHFFTLHLCLPSLKSVLGVPGPESPSPETLIYAEGGGAVVTAPRLLVQGGGWFL